MADFAARWVKLRQRGCRPTSSGNPHHPAGVGGPEDNYAIMVPRSSHREPADIAYSFRRTKRLVRFLAQRESAPVPCSA